MQLAWDNILFYISILFEFLFIQSIKFTETNRSSSWYLQSCKISKFLENFEHTITFDKSYLSKHLIKSFGEVIDELDEN